MITVAEMANEEIYVELQAVGIEMDRLQKENRWHERNELVPRYRELRRAYDWGYKVHERVETIAWQNRWQEAVITEHNDVDALFYVRNDKGWEVGIDGQFIRKIEKVEVKVLPPDPVEQFEQLDLFSI
ncbi:MAG: hypothetical protein RR588_00340 [Solibacillus sp.]